MRADLWEIIQKNWILLLKDVDAEDVTDVLFQNFAVTDADKENVSKGTTPRKKMRNLLQILRNKPDSCNAYDEFLKALKENGYYSHVVEALEKTTATSSRKLFTKGDPTALEDPVREILLKKYTNQPGKTKLCDILQTLQQNVKCPGGFNWSNDHLIKFIPEVFANVTVAAELKPSSTKKTLYVKNLLPLVQCEGEKINDTFSLPGSDCAIESSKTEAATIQKIECTDIGKVSVYDPKELKDYLEKIFQHKNIDTDLPIIFEEQQINGEVFLSLTESEIEKLCPSVKYGVVKTLITLISQINSSASSTQTIREVATLPEVKDEKLRDFTCEVHESDTYILGRSVDIKTSLVSKKLIPVHYFCLLEDFLIREDLLEMLSSKAIQFISACLNNYQDGTIYFGIDPVSGLIAGVNVDEEQVRDCINYYIEKAFPDPNIKSQVQSTLRPPIFMPVMDTSFKKSEKFVIEIDVVAASTCIHSAIKTKLKCLKYLPVSAKKSRKVGYFSFGEQGEPTLVGYDKIEEFFSKIKIASKCRKDEEDMAFSSLPENLRQKLLNLLTGGREKLEDAIYPFFILSPLDPKMNDAYIKQNIQFIKLLETDVVFDFDSTGSSKGIYHCYDAQGELMTVLTLDNFLNSESSTESRKFIESIDTDKVCWVFCNGYKTMSIKPVSPTDWNKNVRSAFHKALMHFVKICTRNRIIIIICLFSKDYETMLEGCEEILTNFPNQWVVYAETESIAEMWKNEMIQRKKVDEKDALNRCIIGMTWEQINDTIEQVTHHTDTYGCILPQAAGTLTKPIAEKKLKCWCDVELLSTADPEVNEDIRQTVMENFYKGESVEWLNFWFEGQVLKRSHHRNLLQLTEKALTEEKENKVSTVILFHHPGSGATTSAKNVLWELRKEYRCCVVRKITDETCNQLTEIRQFSEPSQSPKPLLILVDNEDEEKYRQLKQSLELKCKYLNKENDNNSKVFFTMLFCIRKASLPLQLMPNQMLLEQKLTKQEQKLFGDKHKQLTSEFEKNNGNIDPKFLISFNILKNDFNKEYILKTIKEFVWDVRDERERKLLSYISLLNKYDPYFRSIPVSCFDPVFKNKLEINKKTSDVRRSTNWEANLSQAVQVLLNISPLRKSGTSDARISLRVPHRLVADSLLDYLTTIENKLSDIMLNLINCDIFDHESDEFMFLKNIVGDIMKKREFNQDDGKKEMFSPFITQVNKQCGDEVSISLLCDFFNRNLDPFIAQQIARFYYYLKNWDKAEEYAQKATELKPKCSFLWDTFGQVYKAQLLDETKKLKRQIDKTKMFDNNFVKKLIDLAKKAIYYFKKVQELTENHPSEINENNVAGYFGELKTQIMLLRLLVRCKCFKTRDNLMQCLVKRDFSDQCFNFLLLEEKKFLCDLEDNCMNTVRILDEQYLQVREDVQFDAAVYSGTFGREVQNLISLMFSFHDFFGAPKDFSYIKSLPEPVASMHRWRVAVKLGAMSLNLLLRYRAEREQNFKQFYSNLVTIYNIMLPNINTKAIEFNYLLAMLNAVTLLVLDGMAVKKCTKLSYEQVLEFSRKLFECKQPNEKRPYVEPYMYFVMFNFPSETRNCYPLCTVNKLQEACDRWRDAYDQKFKGAEARTLFYLAKGDLLMDLVHSDTFPMNGRDNWENPKMRKYLVLYAGTVELGGKRVKVKINKDKNTFDLNIPTSYTVSKNLWQKDTYFFIGFSFSGPKAYGIPQDPPEENELFGDLPVEEKYQEDGPSNSRFSNNYEPQRNPTQLSELIKLKSKLDEKQPSWERDELQNEWEVQVENALLD